MQMFVFVTHLYGLDLAREFLFEYKYFMIRSICVRVGSLSIPVEGS